jgi:hypothetical protein
MIRSKYLFTLGILYSQKETQKSIITTLNPTHTHTHTHTH